MYSTKIKKQLINWLKKNDFLFDKIKYYRLRILMLFVRYISDEKYIKIQYRQRIGKKLNLSNPQLYNEKVQYAKLYIHDLSMKKLVDKYEVRSYVRDKIGAQYLTKMYGIYNSIEEINFDGLPDGFVLKLTNGSGFNYICKHKTKKEIKKIKRKFKMWIKIDFYALGREWAYQGVKNRIICEELLDEKGKYGLSDYKIFCFDGVPRLIQVDYDRFKNHKRNLYTTDWQLIDEKVEYENDVNVHIPKPANLDDMLECASKLSKPYSHVRVDFYNIDGRIVFGEMTFYHGAGYLHFESEEFEKKLGKMWELPV